MRLISQKTTRTGGFLPALFAILAVRTARAEDDGPDGHMFRLVTNFTF